MSAIIMIEAARRGDIVTLGKLMDVATSGIHPDVADKDGWTALHEATHYNHIAAVELLLDHKANIHLRGGESWSPIHIAAREGHTALFSLLVDAGAKWSDAGGPENSNGTPLHLAAARGRTDIVVLLLELGKGVDGFVDTVNDFGETALMKSAYGGHMAVVKKLLKAKANRKIRGTSGWAKGRRAWQLADLEGHGRIAELLFIYQKRKCEKLRLCAERVWYFTLGRCIKC